jgi:hypothetical protein
MELTTVGPETLGKVWQNWCLEHSVSNDIWSRSYTHVTRRFGPAKKFEAEFNCILDFGKDKPDAYTYPGWIQFETEEEMTMFLLRFA